MPISSPEPGRAKPAELLDGIYLVRVHRAQYRWHSQFAVIEPKQFADGVLAGRIYCTEKALWKLRWFLQDFN